VGAAMCYPVMIMAALGGGGAVRHGPADGRSLLVLGGRNLCSGDASGRLQFCQAFRSRSDVRPNSQRRRATANFRCRVLHHPSARPGSPCSLATVVVAVQPSAGGIWCSICVLSLISLADTNWLARLEQSHHSCCSRSSADSGLVDNVAVGQMVGALCCVTRSWPSHAGPTAGFRSTVDRGENPQSRGWRGRECNDIIAADALADLILIRCPGGGDRFPLPPSSGRGNCSFQKDDSDCDSSFNYCSV
jgi:hypothetical protein